MDWYPPCWRPYEVDEETARKDVAQVLAKWREIGLLA